MIESGERSVIPTMVGMVITVYLIRLALEGWKRLRLSQAMLTERAGGLPAITGKLIDWRIRWSRPLAPIR